MLMRGFKLCIFLEKTKRIQWLKDLNNSKTFSKVYDVFNEILERIDKKLIIMKRYDINIKDFGNKNLTLISEFLKGKKYKYYSFVFILN